ncbi:YhdP family protein [Parvularcula lutaonensis]|uniref:YhdP family protein n=1 Tax=Parvularcula lutaonensis TaxID=491923 RepID=UPI0040329970
MHLDLGGFMQGPLDVERMNARGTFDAARRKLTFEELGSSYFASELKGFLALTFPEGFAGSPRLEADALLPGPLSPEEVLAGWPITLAREARMWVVDNLKSGVLTNLSYVADIPMGAIKPLVPLRDEDMRFTFDASDATVIYLPDMPPITGLEATATVLGNSFTVSAERGYVSGVRLTEAKLDMPRFTPAGATATFNTTLMGDIETILSALEEAGLVVFEEGVTYTPEDFDGMASFDLKVTWPLVAEPSLDDVKVMGEGAFARGSIDDVLPGIDASDAGGRVILTPEMLTVRGDGLAASAPAKFVWRQNLRGEMKADLAVTADLDTLTADMIGLPLRQFFRGEIKADIYARDLTPGSPMEISGDLTNASVSIPELGLSKPRGVSGLVQTTVAIPEPKSKDGTAGLVSLKQLKLSAPTFNIEGSGVFTQEGGVVRLELPRFFIEDRADLSLRLVTENQNLDLELTGEHADASALIDKMFGLSGDGGPLPGRSDLDVALNRVSLKNGVTLNDVTAQGQHDGKGFEQFILTAQIGEQGVLSATLDAPPTEELGFIEVESTDFGILMNGFFGIDSVTGGAGSIKGTTIEDGGFRGRFEVGELVVQDAPILAKILSFTSLDGAVAALNGEGIRFTKLEGDVWTKDGQIGLGDAKLVGSSLGVSATGVVDLDQNTIDVRGSIAPAYAVNSLLGSLPGIGRLFVSREGEGIVAFSYSITGDLDAPIVTVNTLSALTPGILRRIFEPVTRTEEETRRFLDEAIAEAQKQGDLDKAP